MSIKKTTCPDCHLVGTFDTTALRLSPLKTINCPACGLCFYPKPDAVLGLSDNVRRSRVQEKQAAERYGARKQPASGSLPGAKGDIRERGKLRGECKLTRKLSFSLKLEELLKIQQEATGGEMPLMEVAFVGVFPERKYAVLRAEDYAALKEELADLQELTRRSCIRGTQIEANQDDQGPTEGQ